MILACKTSHGTCQKVVVKPGGKGESPPGGVISISASVGRNGANKPDDVVSIQSALNRVSVDEGGPIQPLVTDGLSGSKTQKAIQTFQLKHFGWNGADGLVEPGRQTLAKLNRLAGSPVRARGAAPGAASTVGQNLIPDMTGTLRTTQDFIRAARANLFLAAPYLETKEAKAEGFEVFGREFRMNLLNKHFEIDRFPNKSQVFNIISNVYHRMNQVFQRPGGLWGAATFEADETGDTSLAYAPVGGFVQGAGRFFFYRGKRLRADSVFICGLMSTLSGQQESQALVIVHELGHFVGFPMVIDDHAYNFQPGKMKNLPPNMRVLNAESYMNFAWEAKHVGRDPPSI